MDSPILTSGTSPPTRLSKEREGCERDKGGVARKMVQSLKEIVNCPETEIYAMLKDCNMTQRDREPPYL
ncbi:hypothetical protein Acr_04g0001960 [Actinidia rufa]|uniref:GBF-interacting protein 1 N-terminal domain-containing protein n=1 Tax=Actinidia rufa TaxID=165716 RepID=A0A7J0EG60_9ERIC|nr:hypothetical protein Acr_04g0001960 [Actinidia rufa]